MLWCEPFRTSIEPLGRLSAKDGDEGIPLAAIKTLDQPLASPASLSENPRAAERGDNAVLLFTFSQNAHAKPKQTREQSRGGNCCCGRCESCHE